MPELDASARHMIHKSRSAELLVDFISKRAVIHVSYRTRERGPWRRFYLVPDEGETVESVVAKILPAIEAHASRESSAGRASVTSSPTPVAEPAVDDA